MGVDFQLYTEKRGLVIDPRTKIYYMIILCIFVLGGAGGYKTGWQQILLSLVPLFLLLTAYRWKMFAMYLISYVAIWLLNGWLISDASGAIRILIAAFLMFAVRIMPALIMGAYIMQTTNVSEFIASMEKMHVPTQIYIPFAVMFRFFPTILEEFRAISAAMRMRGIHFGGKNAGKMIEYRLIPLIVCSVNIGNELSAAALTRGLSVDTKRTNICQVGFHLQDVILFGIGMLPVVTSAFHVIANLS